MLSTPPARHPDVGGLRCTGSLRPLPKKEKAILIGALVGSVAWYLAYHLVEGAIGYASTPVGSSTTVTTRCPPASLVLSWPVTEAMRQWAKLCPL